MKTLKFLFILLLTCNTSAYLLASSGIEQSKTRNLKNFNTIKISTGIDLYIRMDNEESVRVEAADDILNDIKTEVKDGTLHIYMKKHNTWFNWNSFKSKKVFVSVKELVRISALSGSDVKSENTLKGEHLEIKSSSGSDARLTGKAKTLIAESSSGSDIDASGLKASIGKLKASSGSDISASISDELFAKASSGADIRYFGNPSVKDTNESSAGDITGR